MIQHNIDLKEFNTFGISEQCDVFARFSSVQQLKELLTEKGSASLTILGGGSNVLLTKKVDGWVLRNEIKGFEVVKETEDSVEIKVGAGVVWHDFVLMCIAKGLGGIENLSLIPGSVGASPMQNIGAYGVEIKDVFVELEALNLSTLEVEKFDNKTCQFGYRESIFKRSHKGQYVITHVTYRLTKKNHNINSSYGAIESELEKMGVETPTIKDISDAVIAIRSSKLPDPNEIGNAGSFFKNPVVDTSILSSIQEKFENVPNYPAPDEKVKMAAGWLIEKAGWKGKTFDNYGVHKKQALVLVNYGGCQGSEIYDLSQQIIDSVKKLFGIELEREVNVL